MVAQAPDFRYAVGEGWWPLLDRLHERLGAIDPDYRLSGVGEKWGGLRIRLVERAGPDGRADPAHRSAMRAAVSAIEDDSFRTCERCGRAGRPRRRAAERGWIKTLCDDHQTARGGTLH